MSINDREYTGALYQRINDMHNGNNGSNGNNSKPVFLYVEDDAFSREIMARLLKMMGYPEPVIFEDSYNFMDRMHALPKVPDIIFLDVQIGPIDGLSMLKLLRSDDTYKQTKIIAMTASVMSSEIKELRDAGFDGLIGKPIMKRIFPELLQKIEEGESVWYVS
jgi:CheY-like chemotaxis protein